MHMRQASRLALTEVFDPSAPIRNGRLRAVVVVVVDLGACRERL
jgi:hypothetical protein